MLNHRVIDASPRRRGKAEPEKVNLYFLTCDRPGCSCFSYPARDTEAEARTAASEQGWQTGRGGLHTCPVCGGQKGSA